MMEEKQLLIQIGKPALRHQLFAREIEDRHHEAKAEDLHDDVA